MTIARSKIVDPEATRWYHCISNCVRGALLLQSLMADRKEWLEARLRQLAQIFSIEVGNYGVLDSHFHLLLRLNPERALSWSPEEVLRRWAMLYPPRGPSRRPVESLKAWMEEKLLDEAFVNERRERLASLSWFMKSLKEPLARLANAQDGCKGTFWSARYKSIAILDEQALLATAAYIDLNPLAAGLVRLPEEARFTSLRSRLDHCEQRGCLPQLQALKEATVVPPAVSQHLEAGHWLCPIDDTRTAGGERAGLLSGFTLVHYLRLVDITSRLFRQGKARVEAAAEPLLQRLGTTLSVWNATLTQMFSRPLAGVAFAFSRQRLREFAQRRHCRHTVNLNGAPAVMN